MTPEKAPPGVPFIELQSVDSTNNYAMRQVHAGVAQQGFAVFAHRQTAGKGQRGKAWQAAPGANVLLSVVLEPAPLFATPSFLFSQAIAVAAYGLLKNLVSDVKIKWPNDLFIGDRKAGGILIENIVQGHFWKAAIVGIGLNINQTDFGALTHRATSIKHITGKTYDTVALAKDLCRALHEVLKKLETEPHTIETIYQQQLYKKGERVKLKQGSRVFEAQVVGVDASGRLVVQHAAEERFDVGAVEWVFE